MSWYWPEARRYCVFDYVAVLLCFGQPVVDVQLAILKSVRMCRVHLASRCSVIDKLSCVLPVGARCLIGYFIFSMRCPADTRYLTGCPDLGQEVLGDWLSVLISEKRCMVLLISAGRSSGLNYQSLSWPGGALCLTNCPAFVQQVLGGCLAIFNFLRRFQVFRFWSAGAGYLISCPDPTQEVPGVWLLKTAALITTDKCPVFDCLSLSCPTEARCKRNNCPVSSVTGNKSQKIAF